MTLLCPECFENKGLGRRLVEIRPSFDEGNCTYHPRRKGIPIEAVAELVDEVFRANYTFAGVDHIDDPDDPSLFVRRGQTLGDTVQELAQPDDFGVLQNLVDQLIEDDFYLPQRGEDPFYSEEGYRYERITEDGGHGALWSRFCETVTYEQRFTNPQVPELLGQIFKDIDLQRDISRLAPVHVVRPEDQRSILRARVVSDDELELVRQDPAGQLGAPPRRLGKSNRMNPAGIMAFYGAFSLETCISELRPNVGVQIVYAEFRPVRDLVLLDTTRFSAPPKELNLFARDHLRRLNQWRFMQSFMTEIAKPISRDDEPFDYVATQVVAEYLNSVHEVRVGKEKRHIDGIVYRSAQRPAGSNVVLLGEAARTRTVANKTSRRAPSFGIADLLNTPTLGPPALQLVRESVTVTRVEAVEYPSGDTIPLRWLPARPPAQGADPEEAFEDLSNLGEGPADYF